MTKRKKESPAAATAEPSKQVEAQATQADSTSHTSSIVAASEPSEVLKAALFYHSLGFSVIPINPGDKKPAVKRVEGFKQKPASVKQIEEWFGTGSTFQIGIMLGAVSGGLVCRDFDRPDSYKAWAKAYPKLAQTLPTVKTPSKGFHVYAKVSLAMLERQQASYRRIGVKGLDGEMRWKSCYTVAPPSRLPEGCYTFCVPFSDAIKEIAVEALQLDEDWGAPSNNTPLDTEDSDNVANTSEPRITHVINRAPNRTVTMPATPLAVDSPVIQGAISRTRPTGRKQRFGLVFQFARELKAIPAFASEEDLRILRPFVKEWHRQALPYIGTKPFDDTWMDFTRGWPRVKFPAGTASLGELFELAVNALDPPELQDYERPELKLLIKFCRELQLNIDAGGIKPFFLTCRDAAELLTSYYKRNVAFQSVNYWLDGLCRDKVLEKVSVGSQKSRKANEWRYCGRLE